MLKIHFLLAIRQIRQRATFSIILIAGLTVGLAAALLVSTVVINDLSYDRQWPKADRIYRLISTDMVTGEKSAVTEIGLGPELKRNIPGVEDYCRMNRGELRLRLGGNEQGIAVSSLAAEASVFNFLNLEVVEGNPKTPVAGVQNLVITERFRRRFFPQGSPVGRRVSSISTYNAGDTFLITGVVRDLPQNTHLRAEVLEIRQFAERNNSFSQGGSYTLMPGYVLLRPRVDLSAITANANTWYKKAVKRQARTLTSFQPMKDIYLRSDMDGYQSVKGSIRTVYILSATAALLLLIACINYVNLSTAAALKRARATGIRKILGAGRRVLVQQYLLESLVYFFISFCLAALLFILTVPLLESFTGNPLPLGINRQSSVFLLTGTVVFMISVITAVYPAWVLSRPGAVAAFSHSNTVGRRGELFRRGLVVLQFVVSILLLISTLVVHRQVKLLDEAPLGYGKSDLVVINWYEWGKNAVAFRNGLNSISGVQSVSMSRWLPAGGAGSMTSVVQDPDRPDHELTVAFIDADLNFSQTLGLRLLRGRWLSSAYGADAPNLDSLMQHMDALETIQKTQSELITESVAKRFGIKQLGVRIKGFEGIPVGIVADFKNESLKSPQGFCVIQAESGGTYGGVLVRVSPGTSARVKRAIAKLFHQYYPSQVLKMDDATDLLAQQYAGERKLMQIFYFFSGLIIFLSCMGLFGLVTFMVQSHVKEIGIRKVLGASTERVAAMFTWSFLRLVLLSAILAVPLGAWLMSRWLQDYPYRTGLSWWLFALPLLAAALVAALTVGVQSLRAAMANPADALRTE